MRIIATGVWLMWLLVSPAASASEPELVQPEGHWKMVNILAEIATKTPYGFDYDGEARVLARVYRDLPADAPAEESITALAALAKAELEAGRDGAVLQMVQAFELAAALKSPDRRRYMLPLAYQIGVAYFQLARGKECVDERRVSGCVVPSTDVYRNPDAREAVIDAIRYLRLVLDATPTTAARHVTAMWLTNLAYMALGEYPARVPEVYRIDPAKWVGSAFPRFEDVAAATGLDARGYAGGAIAEDFDADGRLDIMVSSVHPEYQLRLFHNQGDGTFEDRTGRSGLLGILGGLHIVQTDFNNDGHPDVVIPRGAWMAANGRMPNSLLRNNGDGTFTDVTFAAGLGQVHFPTQTVTSFDLDNDGFLDLYIGNESTPGQPSPSQLFHNNGNGTFTDVAVAAGVTNDRFAKGVSSGDFDGDGDADLYVSNLDDANRLYRNNGDGTFTDVAIRLGVANPHSSFSTWFWDVDNDGALDLFVTGYPLEGPVHPLVGIAAPYLDRKDRLETQRLYINQGDGHFIDRTTDFDLDVPALPMGSNYGDLDNDGFLDFYLATGYMTYEAVMPNVMFHNVAGHGFEDVTFAGGFGHLAKGHGVAFADLDNDGDQDLVTRLGGALVLDASYDTLHRNPGFGNNWLNVRLIGTTTNRAAIGARIHLVTSDGAEHRSIYRTIGPGSSFGANPLRAEIGLGKATTIETLEVRWPADGTSERFSNIAVNQFIEITEGQGVVVKLNRKSFKLGEVPPTATAPVGLTDRPDDDGGETAKAMKSE